MKQLNLIPDSVRHKAAQVQLVPYMVIAVVIAIGVVAAGGAATSIQLNSANERLGSLTSTGEVSTTPAFTVDADTIARVGTLNNVAAFDIDWDEAYALVQSIVPDAVTLSTFTYTTASTGMDLKFSGTAPSSVAFASFVESLQDNKKLTAPTVTSFSYIPATGVVTFSIDLTIPLTELAYPS